VVVDTHSSSLTPSTLPVLCFSIGLRSTSMLPYLFLLLLAAAAPQVNAQFTVTWPTPPTVTGASSGYTWSSTTTYTPTSLQVPITSTASTTVRISVTRTAIAGQARLQGTLIVTNQLSSQATITQTQITAGTTQGGATCTPTILAGPGGTSTCTFSFTFTPAGEWIRRKGWEKGTRDKQGRGGKGNKEELVLN
jgi:hypothetical protein